MTFVDEARTDVAEAEVDELRPGPGPVHRLRDLSVAGRVAAIVLGLLLLVGPVLSSVHNADHWFPQGDNKYIALRAHDVGTAATPLVGQPSTSSQYDGRGNFAHPGPFEFYLLAPFVRIFDDKTALLLVACLITSTALLTAAYGVFRRWGRAGGLIGVVGLSAVMWSKGAAALAQPISSNIGWLPLLATTVLVWGLLCRDWRLLPAAVVFGSFTAQQHLTVMPAALVLVIWGGVAVALGLLARRRGSPRAGDDELPRMSRWALGVGVICWLPVLVEPFVSFPGNFARMARFTLGGGGGSSSGPPGGLTQVVNALGFPPLLARTELDGDWLVRSVEPLTVLSALLVAGLLTAVAVAWRRRDPTFTRLIITGGGVLLGGFITGTTQPDAPSVNRISYYHWAFTLGFIELLAVGWIVWTFVREWRLAGGGVPRWAEAGAVSVAALVIVVPGVALTVVERDDRQMPNFVAPETIRSVVDVVDRHQDDLGSPFAIFQEGPNTHLQMADTVTQFAREAGMPAQFSPGSIGFVDESHAVDVCGYQHAVVIGLSLNRPRPMPGRRIADVPLYPGWDVDAYQRLVEQARSERVDLGPALKARLARQPAAAQERDTLALAFGLARNPGSVLRDRRLVSILSTTPPVAPALDRDDLQSVLDTFPEGEEHLVGYLVSVSIADRADVREHWPKYAQDC